MTSSMLADLGAGPRSSSGRCAARDETAAKDPEIKSRVRNVRIGLLSSRQ
jgi:hypothetical protein